MLIRRPDFINLILPARAVSRQGLRGRRTFALTLWLVALAAGALAGCAEIETPVRPMSDGMVEEHVAGEVNILRRQQGLQPLQRVAELDHVARMYGWEMVKNANFSHTGVTGDKLEDRLKRANVNDWTIAGENLAYARIDGSDGSAGPADPAAEAVRGWQLSDGHRKNLYQPEFDRCGVAVVRNSQTGEVYIVHLYLGGHGR